MEKTYCVISHTHWDREWYLPLENFRLRLVDLIDNLLKILDKDPGYRFHMDAQTIVLEDYLEIKPYNRGLLEKYIKAERILVGPWYVQNDFHLTSGEATVRNLLIGSRIAEEFGHCTLIGYAPDQFGIISQLPQIFNRFGIDSCIFARGYNFDKLKSSELYWKCEDGSSVLAVYMPFWYNNAQRFSADIDKAMKMLELIDRNLGSTATTSHYLLMNGVDHLEAQEDINGILKEMNERLPEGQHIIQDTMPEYIERVKASVGDLTEYTGEMRNGDLYNLLAGTLSSRVYIKQWNVRSQVLLEKRLEPLYSFLETLDINEYPKDYMNYLWKLLIQNHAHDSICGCSVDAVHEHMVDRFKRIDETGTELLERGLDLLASHIDRGSLSDNQYLIIVANTNQGIYSGIIDIDLEFPLEEEVEVFSIVDEMGNNVPFEIIEKGKRSKSILSPINLPGVIDISYYQIKLYVEVIQGLSYRTFVVTPKEKMDEGTKEEALTNADLHNTLENEYLKVTINPNGTIDLYDKERKIVYRELLILEDIEDVGDSYVFIERPNSSPILSSDITADISQVENNSLSTTYRISYDLSLPEEYCFDMGRRSNAQVDVPVEVLLSLDKASRRLDVSIEIDNKVKDHRLRVLFPTGIDTSISMAGSPFDIIARDKTLIERGIQTVYQQPNTDFINIDGDGYGVAFINEGLYEYENLRDSKNTIALTLLRGNGYITKDGSHVTEEERWLVPGNQCLGKHRFNLAIYPHKGNMLEAKVVEKSQEFLNPVLRYFQPVDATKFAGGRPFVQDSIVAELFFREKEYPNINLPMKGQFIGINSDSMVLSCVKEKEKGDSIIVRLYNSSSDHTSCAIELYKDVERAYFTNLKEERIRELTIKGMSLDIEDIKPKEIVTIELVFKGGRGKK